MAGNINIGLETRSLEYQNKIAEWTACRDAHEGQKRIHERGEIYLPKLEGQKETQYTAYKGRASFLGAFGRTVEAFSGMIFRRDPIEDLPETMGGWSKDVTGDGITLESFAVSFVDELLLNGRAGILVDFPSTEGYGDLTIAQAEALQLVPFLKLYTAESIVNWRLGELPNGGYGIIKLVLQEIYEEESIDNEFETVQVKQYRVLDFYERKYRQRIYREEQQGDTKRSSGVIEEVKDGEHQTTDAESKLTGQMISGYHLYEVFPKIDGKELDYIPFTVTNTKTLTANVEKPPLIDLVNLNIQHYRISADYYHGLHYVGLPTPYITGATEDEAPTSIGPQVIWHLADPNATVGYLQVDAEGFTVLREEMAAIEGRMAAMGARMLAPEKSGVEAAETLTIKSRGEQSTLQKIAGTASRGIVQSLTIARDWMQTDGEITYELNKDFISAELQPQQITALLAAWQAGAITKEVLFTKLKKGEIIDADVNFDDHTEQLEEEAEDMEDMFSAGRKRGVSSRKSTLKRGEKNEDSDEALVDQEQEKRAQRGS